MRRVLFVATVVRTHINEFHLPYMKYLKKNGWSVDVAARNDFIPPDRIKIPYCDCFYDIPFARMPWCFQNLKAYKFLKKIMEKNQYDLIVCNTPVGGALSRLAGKKCNSKMLYIAHGFHFFKGNSLFKNTIFYSIEKYLAQYTDVLVTINQEDYNAAQKFKYRYNGRAFKIDGIGSDTKKIQDVSINRTEKRKEFGFSDDDFVVMTTAEMIPRKNYSVALQAIAKSNIDNIKYLICGSGRQKRELMDLSRTLGIDRRVKFAGYRDDIPELLKMADLFLFPTLQEGLGIAIIEAEAAGLPVLSSSVRGPQDCMIDGKTGFLYNPLDVDGFVEGIRRIRYASQDDIKKMKMYSQKYCQKFDIQHTLQQMIDIYKYMGLIDDEK